MLPKLTVLAIVGIALSLPQAASGGGWWSYINVEDSQLVTGETVEVRDEVFFRSIETATRARSTGEFYVYLIQGLDYGMVNEAMTKPDPRNWWTLGGAEALRVGRVVLDDSNSNVVRAHTRFVVPDLELGRYALMFCDAGCVHPLANVVPTKVAVVGPETARLTNQFDRLQSRMAERMSALGAEVRESVADTATIGVDVDALQGDSVLLQRQIITLERRLDRVDNRRETPWAAYAGWLMAGVSVGWLSAASLKRRRAGEPLLDYPQTSFETEKELLHSS